MVYIFIFKMWILVEPMRAVIIGNGLQISMESLREFDSKLESSGSSGSFLFNGYCIKQTEAERIQVDFQYHITERKISLFQAQESKAGGSRVIQWNSNSSLSHECALYDTDSGLQTSLERQLRIFFEKRITRTKPCEICITGQLGYIDIEDSSIQSSKLEPTLPPLSIQDTSQWYELGKKKEKESGHRLTMLLDLDLLLHSNGTRESEKSDEYSYVKNTLEKVVLTYNPEVLKGIAVFIRSGHTFIIIDNTHSYEDVYRLFFEFGIPIKTWQYKSEIGTVRNTKSLLPEFNSNTLCYHDHLLISETYQTEELNLLRDPKINMDYFKCLATTYSHHSLLGQSFIIPPSSVQTWLAQALSPSEFGGQLYLCTTLKGIVIFDNPVQTKQLKFQKSKIDTNKPFYYDPQAITQLGNFVSNGHRLLVCNNAELDSSDLEPYVSTQHEEKLSD